MLAVHQTAVRGPVEASIEADAIHASDYGWLPGVLDMDAAQAAIDAALASGLPLLLEDGTYLLDIVPDARAMILASGEDGGSLTITGSGATRIEVVPADAGMPMIIAARLDYFELSNLTIDANRSFADGVGSIIARGAIEVHYEHLTIENCGTLLAASAPGTRTELLVFGDIVFDGIHGAAALMTKKNGVAEIVQTGPVTAGDASGALTFDSDPDYSLALPEPLSLTNAAGSGEVLATFDKLHRREVGDWVHIAGADQPEYNGWFQVTEATDLTFRYTAASPPPTSSATGAIEASITPDLLGIESEIGGHELVLTFAAPHGREVGDWIEVRGADQLIYNGRFEVTGATDTTVTVTQALGATTTAATGDFQATTAWGPIETIALGDLDAWGLNSGVLEGGQSDRGQVRAIKLEDGIGIATIGELVGEDFFANTPGTPDRSSMLMLGAGSADLPIHSLDVELVSGIDMGDVVRVQVGRDDFGRLDFETLIAGETRSAFHITPVGDYSAYAEGHGQIDVLRIGHLVLGIGTEVGIRINDSVGPVMGAIVGTLIIEQVTNLAGAPLLELAPGSVARIVGGSGANSFEGTSAGETIEGRGGRDVLDGLAGDDVLIGGSGRDVLRGGEGADTLTGKGGDDVLLGGAGSDTLTGGIGADTFQFDDGDSAAAHALADVVADFGAGDRIKLKPIDADEGKAGDQKFVFIGAAEFGGQARQLHYVHDGGNTFIEGDTDGDGLADFVIRLDGLHNLINADFVL